MDLVWITYIQSNVTTENKSSFGKGFPAMFPGIADSGMCVQSQKMSNLKIAVLIKF
jgi:hypothetical protein